MPLTISLTSRGSQIIHCVAQSAKKTFPTAHHGVQKTTKFTLAIIALGIIRGKHSPKDLQEVKQFFYQVGEITESVASKKPTVVSKALEKQVKPLEKICLSAACTVLEYTHLNQIHIFLHGGLLDRF